MTIEENLSACMGAIKTDIHWIKEALKDSEKKYAPAWIKYPVYGLSAGTLFWALNQLLTLIPNVKGLFY